MIDMIHVCSLFPLSFCVHTSLQLPLASVEPCVILEACCVRFWDQQTFMSKYMPSFPRSEFLEAVLSDAGVAKLSLFLEVCLSVQSVWRSAEFPRVVH